MDCALHYEDLLETVYLDYAVDLIFVVIAIGVKVGREAYFFHEQGQGHGFVGSGVEDFRLEC